MGSFSWLRADTCTRRANLTDGDKYKILIPEEFGGGYILDEYYDYGYINEYGEAVYVDKDGNKTPLGDCRGDLYGLLTYMNKDHLNHVMIEYYDIKYINSWKEDVSNNIIDILKNGDTENQNIRCFGIGIGCYPSQINCLKYPLKLVSRSYKDTYEECWMKSYSDPNQGFGACNWDDYKSDIYERYHAMH